SSRAATRPARHCNHLQMSGVAHSSRLSPSGIAAAHHPDQTQTPALSRSETRRETSSRTDLQSIAGWLSSLYLTDRVRNYLRDWRQTPGKLHQETGPE